MKIIDLLNKIANGEEVPNKFNFAHLTFEKNGNYYIDKDGDSIFESLFTDFSNLNDEIEIIEEPKKIEKLTWNEKCKYKDWTTSDFDRMLMNRTEQLKKSLNEIIDKLNEVDGNE